MKNSELALYTDYLLSSTKWVKLTPYFIAACARPHCVRGTFSPEKASFKANIRLPEGVKALLRKENPLIFSIKSASGAMKTGVGSYVIHSTAKTPRLRGNYGNKR
ncbi:hypothetical protein [Polaromonas sp.]|uniref:hypothetical protein n=1 Tax=Polaromonas sp. TaxID=1869339 RepID=UPI003BB581F0